MSKTINVQDSLVFNPTTYDSSSTWSSSYITGTSNACTSTSNTSNYARFSLRNSTSYTAIYSFNISGIPSGATITSVTGQVRAAIQNTSYTANVQLYSGTTAKGSSTNINSTTASTSGGSLWTVNGGTSWTLEEVSNLKLRFVPNNVSSNNNRYLYVYGADISVNYSISGTAYTITSTSSVDGVTVSPATQDILSGESGIVTIEGVSDLNDITVTDNDTDVTSNLVEKQYSPEGAVDTNLGAYTLVSGSFNGSGASYFQGIVGNGVNASQTTSNYYSGGSGTIAVFTYNMAFTNIPSNATITRVYCQVNGHAESTSNSNEYMCVQLRSGDTELSDELNFKSVSTSNSTQTIEATTLPTISQLANLVLYCRLGYYGGAINGATCYVTYTMPSSGTYYEYTISNISSDHVILIEEAGAFIPPEEDPEYTYYPVTISSINATTNPGTGTTRVVEGSNQTITIYPDDPLVTLILDNGTDVSSQLVTHAGTSPTYTVTTVSGADYGFNLNSSTGYYVSANTGIDKSTALSRVNFDLPVRCLVTLSFINNAEETYDFGVFGKVDTELSTTYWQSSQSSGDTTTDAGLEQLRCNTSTYNTTTAQTLTYEIPAGEHFIDIKFSKDDQSASGNDSLQWKIDSIQELDPNNYYTYTLSNIQQKHSLIFVFGDVQYYYITSSGTNCKLYPDGQFVELAGDAYNLTIVPNNMNDVITVRDNNVDVSSSLEMKTSTVEKDGSTITYKSYNYTLTNISAAHNIVVSTTSGSTVYYKVNGSWVSVSKVYKKIDDRWQEQTNFDNLFDTNTIYINV